MSTDRYGLPEAHPADGPQPSSTAPAVTGHRWSGKKTAVVAAMAIGLGSAGAITAAAAVPQGTGASQGGPGGMGPGGGPGGMGGHAGPMGQLPQGQLPQGQNQQGQTQQGQLPQGQNQQGQNQQGMPGAGTTAQQLPQGVPQQGGAGPATSGS